MTSEATTWKQVAVHVAWDCPEFIFELDEHRNDAGDQMMFIHLTARKWSKAVLKEMLRVFTAFRVCVSCPLYAIGSVDDSKFEKFAALFGLTPIQNVVCENGETRRLYMNLKDINNNGQSQPDFTGTKPIWND